MEYSLIEYLYEAGVLDLKRVAKEVELGNITEQDFHFITTYNYQAIKNKDE